ncbi:MAG: hypothetical protein ACO1RA_02365 [Planctomycetaceae bacterium]
MNAVQINSGVRSATVNGVTVSRRKSGGSGRGANYSCGKYIAATPAKLRDAMIRNGESQESAEAAYIAGHEILKSIR